MTMRDPFNIKSDNGYVVSSGIELNSDVLTMILAHLSPEDLVFNCRLVCKNWCDLIDANVWKLKLKLAPKEYDNMHARLLPWYLLFWILKKRCFYRNLIYNPSGIEQFKGWKILSNGGNHWKVENPPVGVFDVGMQTSCFVSSFHSCSKEQMVDLAKEGAVPALMDKFQPEICVSEWYAGRWDCSAIYELEVNLVNQTGDFVDTFKIREKCGSENGSQWRQVTHTFRKYDRGVRYIRFYHGGVDEQFWAGHYGSKMAGASVQLIFPLSTSL